MDWKNVNLKDGYEKHQQIIDGLSFDTLLLEIECNLKVISEETVRAQFLEDLENRITSAKEVFELNISNITKHAQEDRKNR